MTDLKLNTLARLSAAGFLAAMVAACGSGSDSDSAPANTQSSSSTATAESSSQAAESSSSEAASSETASSSSSPIDSIVTASCGESTVDFIECLDFESVAPGNTPEGFNKSGSGITVVEGEGAYSGTLSLKVSGSGASFLTAVDDIPGTHWGRMYYKNIDHISPVPSWSHTTLVAGSDGSTDFRIIDMVAAPEGQNTHGSYQHLYNIDNENNIDLSLEGPYDHSYGDDWVCIEWQLDSIAQEYRVFFNGSELSLANQGTRSNSTDLKNAKKWDGSTHDFVPVPDTWDTFKIGIQNYQGHSYTFLLDDIALNDSRIGCEIANETASSSEASSSSEEASSSSEAVILGKAEYDAMCKSCHEGGSGPDLVSSTLSGSALVTKIDTSMPTTAPSDCEGQCATDVADYIENVLRTQ